MKQKIVSHTNQIGWNQSAYQAWTNRHGTPKEYAQKLIANPTNSVAHYLKFIGEVKDKKIANLLGSKGNKAVSFALLGAEVTVVDISQDNKKYAMELADEAKVNIKYIVSDILEVPDVDVLTDFDATLLELGVLHYFVDLLPLFKVVYDSLKTGGQFILRDYHPFVSKLMNVEGGRMIANGDYFNKDLIEEDVAYSTLLSEEERASLQKVTIRRWTLGEIVTAISGAGFRISYLEEEVGVRWAFPTGTPEGIEDKVPALYTLIAIKEE
ncbi:class I SAM-dependent methyltransferase [Psychrobacillus lasiicapitis]|uniref:Class I SAM-dependent methyltransferase n=1 Tax=Psychrobacillus lasiicapitis TaxID=1636719 RepID=A0A544SZN7_9BACI|nr:class I SAM-dependent methyltransferase [Psychrobacillus lasiicapitis]TQR10639.1 class I SAM-dependent methyltransferase [Psychrobacillus lasiicapitis]GGA43850.1 methyltransferase [Psychrobacillus lasiicapitis]